jgi:hypothetical protein
MSFNGMFCKVFILSAAINRPASIAHKIKTATFTALFWPPFRKSQLCMFAIFKATFESHFHQKHVGYGWHDGNSAKNCALHSL